MLLSNATLQDAILRLMRGFSIEAMPRETHKAQEWRAILHPGARIYLTRLPKADFAETVAAAKRVYEAGFVPVPHLTARSVETADDLYEHTSALVDAGVDDILLVAGSQPKPLGPFENTMQVLESGVLQRAGVRFVGVAGHPEEHPAVTNAQLDEALEWKNSYARSSGLAMYVVTQFFFEAAPVIAWERRVRERGNRLPIHVGFHGLTNAARLLKYAISCGIGSSIKALGERSNVLKAAAVRSPEHLVVAIARATLDDPASRFASAHFFPLGAFDGTAKWADAVVQQRIRLR
jgi:methylenetetrahydrofolate reductase (NADPH)